MDTLFALAVYVVVYARMIAVMCLALGLLIYLVGAFYFDWFCRPRWR